MELVPINRGSFHYCSVRFVFIRYAENEKLFFRVTTILYPHTRKILPERNCVTLCLGAGLCFVSFYIKFSSCSILEIRNETLIKTAITKNEFKDSVIA